MASLSPQTWIPHRMVILTFSLGSCTAKTSLPHSIGQNRTQSPPSFKGRGLALIGRRGKEFVTVLNPSRNQIQAVSLHLQLCCISHLFLIKAVFKEPWTCDYSNCLCISILYECSHLSQALTLGIFLSPTLSLNRHYFCLELVSFVVVNITKEKQPKYSWVKED